LALLRDKHYLIGGVKVKHRAYVYYVEPEIYPEYRKRWVKAVTREDLDDKIQFTTFRVFTIKDGEIINYKEDLDIYTKKFKLGNIIWPFCSTLFAKNFNELVDEIKSRGLYLFDFWGYVPGSDPTRQSWGQYSPPEEAIRYMKEVLGNHFLGLDNGEQDGRYIGGYAPLMCPAYRDLRRQYFNFSRFFEALGDDLYHHLAVLCSLNFGHYFAKEGDSIILGEESGQALPNVNVWFSFLRGASKQYGILLFGNVSVWNRWGYKCYESEGQEKGYEWGPECGTSLSLLKRLLYTEYMYNCEILGFEQSWLTNDNTEKRIKGEKVPFQDDPSKAMLSPVGEIQAKAVEFVEKYGRPGVIYTPIAILMDFFNGWTFPRHLYTSEVYKIWGNLPYRLGDYQVHALFTMLYPGYENSGFFRDERGFLTSTPYGDSFDVIFSDARREIFGIYNKVFVAGEIDLNLEVLDKLLKFVEDGGHLILSVNQLPKDKSLLRLFEIDSIVDSVTTAKEAIYKGNRYLEKPFEVKDVKLLKDADIIATAEGLPLIVRITKGKGKIDIICTPFGINSEAEKEIVIDNSPEKEIPLVYDFLNVIKAYLNDLWNEELIIDLDNRNLQYCVDLLEDGKVMTLSVTNNTDETQSFNIKAKAGEIEKIEELVIEGPPPSTKGYYPRNAKINHKAKEEGYDYSIESREIRIFRIRLKDTDIEKKPQLVFQDKSKNRALSLRNISSLKEEILFRPTFDQFFDGIKIDAGYLIDKDIESLKYEAEFIKRQRINLILDFSPLLNFYPDLTLLDNIPSRYEETRDTIEKAFKKAQIMGIKDVLFSFHRNAENWVTIEEAESSFKKNFKELAEIASKYEITMYLQNNPWRRWRKTMRETIEFIKELSVPNLKLALNVAHCIASGEDPKDYVKETEIILLSSPAKDRYGQFYDVHDPVFNSEFAETIKGVFDIVKDSSTVKVCLDGVYKNWDEVYRDIIWLNEGRRL